VTSTIQRQRAAARARLERQTADRLEHARKRKRRNVTIASSVAVLLVVGGVVWLATSVAGGDGTADDNVAANGATCMWQPEVTATNDPNNPGNPNLKDVGTPGASAPNKGTQTMTMKLNSGVVEVEVATSKAPCAAASMTYLAGKKFFDGSTCHRMTTEGIHVLQCGDPSATGMGGPTYKFAEENLPNTIDPNDAYPIGTIAMAKTQAPASTGSQFFIVWGATPLNGDYTVLGKITKGLDVVQKIGAGPVLDPETGLETTADGKKVTDGKPKTEVKIESLTVTPAAA
jgi:peptidyl-prolyl cis-trans isomerase B (cyclophilin B)